MFALNSTSSTAGPGHPLRCATIHLVDLDYIRFPKEPYVLDLKTGRDGKVAKVLPLLYNTVRGSI